MTDERSARDAGAAQGGLHLLPLRVAEPPYDDEADAPLLAAAAARPAGQGSLALAFSLPSGLPAAPQAPAALRLVHGGRSRPGHVPPGHVQPGPDAADGGELAPLATPRVALPEPHRWTARLLQAVLEVLAGDRPPAQLVRWTSEPVYVDIERRAVANARRVRRAEGRPQQRSATPAVCSVHVSEPGNGVAEACAVVRFGPRRRAAALRLEGLDGRWQCTAFTLG